MLVKLLKSIEEGAGVKTVQRRGRPDVVFSKNAVIEMSDASAQKYIESGLAEKVVPPVKQETKS